MNKQTQYHIDHVFGIYDSISARMRAGGGINPADVAILTLAVVQSETAEQVNGLVRVSDR